MHLLPAERSGHRVIDAERVCQAIAALAALGGTDGVGGASGSGASGGSSASGGSEAIEDRARRFALLGDPTRLALLTCIHAAGPISVSDLAAATGINDVTVSQTLRYLRAAQAVSAQRDGRVVRYQLTSTPIKALLSGAAW